jgi:hypothetical protein
MTGETVHLDRLVAEGPQSILERTLIAEYLLSQGYLTSDLWELPPQAAKSLMSEACRFAALRLAEIEAKVEFRQKIRLPISLN